MAMSPRLQLSTLFADPFVRAAFERAERDVPGDFAVAHITNPPTLTDGAAERVHVRELAAAA
jgi:hypothetical protein